MSRFMDTGISRDTETEGYALCVRAGRSMESQNRYTAAGGSHWSQYNVSTVGCFTCWHIVFTTPGRGAVSNVCSSAASFWRTYWQRMLR